MACPNPSIFLNIEPWRDPDFGFEPASSNDEAERYGQLRSAAKPLHAASALAALAIDGTHPAPKTEPDEMVRTPISRSRAWSTAHEE